MAEAIGVCGSDNGTALHVIDISNQANPRRVGYRGRYNSSVSGYAHRGVAVSGNYAYVASWEAGLQVIDIRSPANPQRLGGYDTTDQANWTHIVAVSENFAYVAGEGAGLEVIDISNPANPRSVGSYETSDSTVDVEISGDYAYVTAARFFAPSHVGGLRVIDVSDPAHPRRVGSYDYSEDCCNPRHTAGRVRCWRACALIRPKRWLSDAISSSSACSSDVSAPARFFSNNSLTRCTDCSEGRNARIWPGCGPRARKSTTSCASAEVSDHCWRSPRLMSANRFPGCGSIRSARSSGISMVTCMAPRLALASGTVKPRPPATSDFPDYEMQHFAFPRHANRINVVYLDGSARSTRVRELWSLKWHREWDTEAWRMWVQFPAWLK